MEQSPLGKLSPELRNRIYHDVLVDVEDIINQRPHRERLKLQLKYQWQAPALLQTCKQVRNEAIAMYYSLNIFRFRPDWDWEDERELEELPERETKAQVNSLISSWFIMLGNRTGSLIRHIRSDCVVLQPRTACYRIATTKKRLQRKHVPLPVARIEVDVDNGNSADQKIGYRRWWTDGQAELTDSRFDFDKFQEVESGDESGDERD